MLVRSTLNDKTKKDEPARGGWVSKRKKLTASRFHASVRSIFDAMTATSTTSYSDDDNDDGESERECARQTCLSRKKENELYEGRRECKKGVAEKGSGRWERKEKRRGEGIYESSNEY